MNLRQKINQLFIVGYGGDDFSKNTIFTELLRENLGGVIFFTQNIISKEQFCKNVDGIKKLAKTPLFLSIDQEGGRVERTENIHGGKKYLSAKYAAEKGMDFVKKQSEEIADELISYGLNMNFSPDLDVNTNPKNPIIGERAYSDKPDEAAKFGICVFKTYQEKGIIPVGKHFAGHGDTSTDSHLEMPVVNLSKDEMKNTHLKPFVEAINNGIDAIMASHVYYSCYDDEPIPASLSQNILTNLLRNELKFEGLVLSDDMVMGAVCEKDPSIIYSKALKAGINTFLYRNSDEKLLSILDNIERNAKKDEELSHVINYSYEKVIELKNKYSLLLNKEVSK